MVHHLNHNTAAYFNRWREKVSSFSFTIIIGIKSSFPTGRLTWQGSLSTRNDGRRLDDIFPGGVGNWEQTYALGQDEGQLAGKQLARQNLEVLVATKMSMGQQCAWW